MAAPRRGNNVDSRIFNFADVPISGVLPEGSYNMRIASLEQRYSQANSVLMFTMELRVDEPAAMFGRGLFETFVFGTTPFDPGQSRNPDFIAYSKLDDPEAEDPLTLRMSRGVQSFKQVMHFAGCDMDREVDMAELTALCNSGDLRVGMRLRVEEEKRSGPYEGTLRNKIAHIYEIGREEPGFASNPARTPRRAARNGQSAAPTSERRRAQPDTMRRALNSPRTRAQLERDFGFTPDGDDILDDIPEENLVQPGMPEERFVQLGTLEESPVQPRTPRDAPPQIPDTD